MVEKEVSFQDKQGREIVGTLAIPNGIGSFPAVIVCHGFKGNQNERHIKAIAEALTRPGLATLRFDFTKGPGRSSLPFEEMTVSYELEVLDQAFEFLKTKNEVTPEEIGLAGHSLGGLVASWYTANHPGVVKSLVTLSAVYSFSETFERHYGAWVAESKQKGFGYVYSSSLRSNLKLLRNFYDDGINYEMDKVIEEINCPVMVLCGTSDSLINHSQNYFDRLRSREKKLKTITGSDHNYSREEDLNKVNQAVVDWFAKTLLEKSN